MPFLLLWAFHPSVVHRLFAYKQRVSAENRDIERWKQNNVVWRIIILFDSMWYPVYHFHFNKLLVQYSLVSSFYNSVINCVINFYTFLYYLFCSFLCTVCCRIRSYFQISMSPLRISLTECHILNWYCPNQNLFSSKSHVAQAMFSEDSPYWLEFLTGFYAFKNFLEHCGWNKIALSNSSNEHNYKLIPTKRVVKI